MQWKSIGAMGVLTLVAALDVAAASAMHAGIWEITTKMEMPGMPMAVPPQVFRQCYREDNLKDPKNMVPQDKDCKADSVTISGNTVSWRVRCTIDGEAMAGDGRVTFAGQSYTGKAQLSGKMEGMTMKANINYSGKRIGDCK